MVDDQCLGQQAAWVAETLHAQVFAGQAVLAHTSETFAEVTDELLMTQHEDHLTSGIGVGTELLVNFGEAVNFPLILGFMLALFGAATLLHLLVVSVVRRRREIGLLKALGFVNGQIGAAVCWQATTVAVVGIVVGIPLGIAVGQVVWRAFATNLGAVPISVVPAWLLAALGAGVLVVANLLAIGPTVAAARSKTAGQLLRTQ